MCYAMTVSRSHYRGRAGCRGTHRGKIGICFKNNDSTGTPALCNTCCGLWTFFIAAFQSKLKRGWASGTLQWEPVVKHRVFSKSIYITHAERQSLISAPVKVKC